MVPTQILVFENSKSRHFINGSVIFVINSCKEDFEGKGIIDAEIP